MRTFPVIIKSISSHRRSVAWLANEGNTVAVTLLLPNQLAPQMPGQDHWVQLSPFGDFANHNGNAKIIQRFRPEDAQHICDEFNSPLRRITQPLGMPFYIGHPDHPRFKGQPGHQDTRAYGRGKEMQVRQDAKCPACAAFANQESDAAPCPDHGLFVRMHWNDEGARLIGHENYYGHSVNWAAQAQGSEKGVPVFRPVRVKSAGFTNEPNIPVRPASLAKAATSDGEEQDSYPVPARLKVLAGYAEDDDVTLDEVIAALEKARPVANEADYSALEALQGELANERRARAEAVVEGLVRAGRVLTRDRVPAIEQLCNAGDDFDKRAAELGNARPVIKTEARSTGLAGRHAQVIETEQQRAARLQELMDSRRREFPNESYEERFQGVANSHDGMQLFAQMRRAGAEE